MLCPVCKNPLIKITTRSDYGAVLNLDRCGYCGGLWLEGLSLYQLPPKEAERIESLPRVAGFYQSSGERSVCPVCGIKLKPLSDINLPREIHIAHCDHCGGSWTDANDLMAFKNYQRRKQFRSKALQFREALLKEQTLSFLFILFIALVIPASIYLALRGTDGVGEALVGEEKNRIINVQVFDLSFSSVTLRWETSFKSTSQVEYGFSKEYGFITPVEVEFVEEHEVLLQGLRANTPYHFRVLSQDKKGEITSSPDKTFTTRP